MKKKSHLEIVSSHVIKKELKGKKTRYYLPTVGLRVEDQQRRMGEKTKKKRRGGGETCILHPSHSIGEISSW